MLMILRCHPKYASGGWTIFDMFFVTLAAGSAALLVSICFPRELHGAVFVISYVVFSFIFWFLYIFWLIPALMRRQQKKRNEQK